MGAHKVTMPFGIGTGEVFDFLSNVYWVDAQLIKSVPIGNRRVEEIQICTNLVG